MSRYRFELATGADDAGLRNVLAQTPMPGAISVGFRREPSYLAAAIVEGRFRQAIAARDITDGQIVGLGARSVSLRYVNGQPAPIGYLSSLRILPAHRNGSLLARGYRFLHHLHEDGRTPLYLTTIAEGNQRAISLLSSGRAGLPNYHFAGHYHTAAIPRRRARCTETISTEIRPATAGDLPAIVAFLNQIGPLRQFFPCYCEEDFCSEQGLLRGLRPMDILLAFRDGRLAGTLGAWDQHRWRQTVVHAYSRTLRWGRPFYNAWASLRGAPRLPRPGEPVRCLAAALPVVAGDDPALFRSLIEAALERMADGPNEHLLLGLHQRDPLLDVLQSFSATWYTTRLYLVSWPDGEDLLRSLDGRPPYLELGAL